MRPSDHVLRRRLAAIVTQGWLIGAVGGTAADLLTLRLIGTLPLELASAPIGVAVATGVLVALILSGIPFAIAIAAIMLAPRAVARWRIALSFAAPAMIVGLWMVLADAVPSSRVLAALVFLDAALAAAWFWHRTKTMSRSDSVRLATVFE